MKAQDKASGSKKTATTTKSVSRRSVKGNDNTATAATVTIGGSAKKRKISAATSEATTERLDAEDEDVKAGGKIKQESETEAEDDE